MPSYKLYKFNVCDCSEACRLILAASAQNIDDIRYEFNGWPARKVEMPVLQYDETKLSQSMIIARFSCFSW